MPRPAHRSCRGRALTAAIPVTPRAPGRAAAAASPPDVRRAAAPAPAAPPGAPAPPRRPLGRSRRSGSPPPAACGTAPLPRVPAPPGAAPARPPPRAHLSRSCRSCSASASFSRCRSAAAGPGPFGAAPPQRAMCRPPLRSAPGTAKDTGQSVPRRRAAALTDSTGTALGARAVTGPGAGAPRDPRRAGRGSFPAPLAGRGQQAPPLMRAGVASLAPPPVGYQRGGWGLPDGGGASLTGWCFSRPRAVPPGVRPLPASAPPHSRGPLLHTGAAPARVSRSHRGALPYSRAVSVLEGRFRNRRPFPPRPPRAAPSCEGPGVPRPPLPCAPAAA